MKITIDFLSKNGKHARIVWDMRSMAYQWEHDGLAYGDFETAAEAEEAAMEWLNSE